MRASITAHARRLEDHPAAQAETFPLRRRRKHSPRGPLTNLRSPLSMVWSRVVGTSFGQLSATIKIDATARDARASEQFQFTRPYVPEARADALQESPRHRERRQRFGPRSASVAGFGQSLFLGNRGSIQARHATCATLDISPPARQRGDPGGRRAICGGAALATSGSQSQT